MVSSRGLSPVEAERKHKTMSDTIKRNIEKTGRKAEETRAKLKDSLYKAKAGGRMTEDDEAELLRYARGVVAKRGKMPRE